MGVRKFTEASTTVDASAKKSIHDSMGGEGSICCGDMNRPLAVIREAVDEDVMMRR